MTALTIRAAERATRAYRAAVLAQTCAALGVDAAIVAGPSRERSAVAMRRAVVAKLREARWSYPEIGTMLGRHHTSVMYLAKTTKEVVR